MKAFRLELYDNSEQNESKQIKTSINTDIQWIANVDRSVNRDWNFC